MRPPRVTEVSCSSPWTGRWPEGKWNKLDTARAGAKGRQLFDFGLLARGIHLHPDKPFYTCTAHSDKDIDTTLKAAEDVLKRMA